MRLTLLFLFLASLVSAQIVVTDGSLNGSQTWTADNEYLLDGYVFVPEGAVLTIEPGTVIKAKSTPTDGSNASALIVQRGAQIQAVGTAEQPIIFTSEFDVDLTTNTDIDKNRKGLWGGLIILGRGIVGVDGGVQNVEGIPSTEGRAEYGGTNNEDYSGALKYVSIRHGGAKLEANNEINGLTLAGVGSATEIDYIEVFANFDDGIEWFGGAVDVKHAVVSFCGDDSFDYDQSWDGKGQFWFTLQDSLSNRAGEWDGSEAADLTPKVTPVIANCTFIGGGDESFHEDDNDALRIRDAAGVKLYNSVITGFNKRAINIDNDFAGDSYDRYVEGDVVFGSNIFHDFNAGTTLEDIINVDGGDQAAFIADFTAKGNSHEAANLAGIARWANGGLDPRANADSPALSGATLLEDDFFDLVPFRGAFGNDNNWATGWTALSANGYFGDLVTPVSSSTIIVKDSDINAGDNVEWTSNNEYVLDGYVFVEEGATLKIQAGTVIKGKSTPSNGDNSSALIITRGAKIEAIGTAEQPIIFTSEFDVDLTTNADIDKNRKGLWGGLILLGKGIVGVDGGVQNIEGIPSTEGRAEYGGTDNTDNSGILKYISIRHGGAKLEANNEINGLTLGGVGSGTTIDYVEVFANLDDGIEWFGGAVDVKHAVVSFCGDDSFDYDQAWDGKGQFWFTLQDSLSNRAGEWDGSEAADLTPLVAPVIANCTFIGAGDESFHEDDNDALRIRDAAGVKLYNSVITGFNKRGINIDNDFEGDSYDRYLAGDVVFGNNIFNDFNAGNTLEEMINVDGGDQAGFISDFTAKGNTLQDAGLAGIARWANGGLDPRANDGSPALSGAQLLEDDFFSLVPYRGAFGNSDNWAEGWTALSANGYFGNLVTPVTSETIIVRDGDINPGDKVEWTNNNEYILDGYVFVETGACLTIQPGTVIRAKSTPSNGDNSTALIIAKGGMIQAVGTADQPIIFTSEFDVDLTTNSDVDKNRKGLWGGLILLGNAVVGVDGGVQNVEGIPSTEGRAEYGGNDNNDNSGALKYVSIRHGGAKLEANNEINGLTLAGVGSGTSIEYVEVFANLDDGIEWFGGTVDVKYAVVSFCGDDSFDYDQAWDGNGQFWFTLQDSLSNRAGEWDGSERADLGPSVSPTIANCTFIGAGGESFHEDGNDALRIRDAGAVKLYNSIITDFDKRAINIDNDFDGDSYDRYTAGDIVFGNNLVWGFNAGESLEDFMNVDGGDQAAFITNFLADNKHANPQIAGISRWANGGLDPRVNWGDAIQAGQPIPSDNDFFDNVSFIGAFANDQDNWAIGWTALSDNGYFGDIVNGTNDPLSEVDENINVYPNPTAGYATVAFELAQASSISIEVADIMGRVISTPVAQQTLTVGQQAVELDLTDLDRGTYIVLIKGEAGVIAKSLLIKE